MKWRWIRRVLILVMLAVLTAVAIQEGAIDRMWLGLLSVTSFTLADWLDEEAS